MTRTEENVKKFIEAAIKYEEVQNKGNSRAMDRLSVAKISS